jgi:hypothetical protein
MAGGGEMEEEGAEAALPTWPHSHSATVAS